MAQAALRDDFRGRAREPPSEAVLVETPTRTTRRRAKGALVVVAPTDKAWPEDVPLQCEPEIQGQPWALLALMAGETRDAVQAKLEDVNADDPFASLVDVKLSREAAAAQATGARRRVSNAPLTSQEDIRAACAPLSFDGMQRARCPTNCIGLAVLPWPTAP